MFLGEIPKRSRFALLGRRSAVGVSSEMADHGFVTIANRFYNGIWYDSDTDDRPYSDQNMRPSKKAIIAIVVVGVVITSLIAVGSIYVMQTDWSAPTTMIECPSPTHEPYLTRVRDFESRYVAKLDSIMQIERDSVRHQDVFVKEVNQRLISIHHSLAHLAAEMRGLPPPEGLSALTRSFSDFAELTGQYAALSVSAFSNLKPQQMERAQAMRDRMVDAHQMFLEIDDSTAELCR